MRRRRTKAPASDLPIAVLHFLACGSKLSDAEGVARYGPGYVLVDVWTHHQPRDRAVIYQRHRAAIEQHARALGRAQSWAGEQLNDDKET